MIRFLISQPGTNDGYMMCSATPVEVAKSGMAFLSRCFLDIAIFFWAKYILKSILTLSNRVLFFLDL